MANNRFNKQVSPKGYQKGGPVKQSPMGSSSTKGNILRGKLKSQKELKKITGSKKYKDASYGEKTKMLNVATMAMGGRIRKMGGGMMMQRPMMQEGGKTKKRGKDFMSASSTDARKIAGRGGGADSGKAGEARSKAGVQEVRIKKGIKNVGKKIKDIVTLKKFHDAAKKASQKALAEGKTGRGTAEPIGKRRVRRMGGGSLKAVNPQTQKGLSKLPTEVRNKMGYMKKGGKVHGK